MRKQLEDVFANPRSGSRRRGTGRQPNLQRSRVTAPLLRRIDSAAYLYMARTERRRCARCVCVCACLCGATDANCALRPHPDSLLCCVRFSPVCAACALNKAVFKGTPNCSHRFLEAPARAALPPPLRYAQSSGTSLTFQIKSPPTVFRTVFAKKTLQQFWCRNPGSRPHNEHHGSTTEKTKSHQKQHRQDDGNRQRATPSVTSSNR